MFNQKWVHPILLQIHDVQQDSLPFLSIFCRALIKAMMSASAFGSPVIGMLFFLGLKEKGFIDVKMI